MPIIKQYTKLISIFEFVSVNFHNYFDDLIFFSRAERNKGTTSGEKKGKVRERVSGKTGNVCFRKTRAALLPTISINSPNCQKHLQSTRSRRRKSRAKDSTLCPRLIKQSSEKRGCTTNSHRAHSQPPGGISSTDDRAVPCRGSTSANKEEER